jgi:hypothetical protein
LGFVRRPVLMLQSGMMDTELIAPCGMNCGVCSSFLARRYDTKSRGIKISYCTGCRPRGKMCAFLKKRCTLLRTKQVEYCYQCQAFPCDDLSGLDNRYKTLYHMSMVDNLVYLREHGMEKLLIQQMEHWRCPGCGEVICCHNGVCFNCGLASLRGRKKLYRWEDT